MSAVRKSTGLIPLVDEMLGSKVGLYRVVRRIGQGGMGVVYEARHEHIGQRAAVKVLMRDLARDDRILERFIEEARTMTMVQHEGIVKVFDFGQLPNGVPYILMEYLDGQSLKERLGEAAAQGGGLALPIAIEIARQVASALAALHKKNIVHRDLKPDNLFLVQDSLVFGGERVKLLDFGLAKLLTTEVRRTSEGAILGTPIYMSPEQWQGGHRLGPKSDVYALGSLFFEMLTGQPPFFGTSPSELMYQHVNRRPPLLSELALDVPQRLDGLLAVMLSKEPVTRPHMEDVASVLSTLREEAGLRGPLQMLEATPLAISVTASEGLSDTLGAEPRATARTAKAEPAPPAPAAASTTSGAFPQTSETTPEATLTPSGPAAIVAGTASRRISREGVQPISGLTPVTPTAAARSSSLSAISVSVAPPPSRRLLWRLVTAGVVGLILLTVISLAVLRHRPVSPQSAAKPPVTTPTEAIPIPSVPVATPTNSGVSPTTPASVGASAAPSNPSESAESSRKAGKRKRRSSSKQKDALDSKGDDPMTVFREH